MEILIHARNCTLAEDFQGIVSEKLNSLSRFKVTIDSVKVEVMHESNPRFGHMSHEVVLTTQGSGPFIRASGAAFNDVAAFDEAVVAFELQLRKSHERSKEVKHGSIRGEGSVLPSLDYILRR